MRELTKKQHEKHIKALELLDKMDREERAYEERMRQALGCVYSLDYEYEDAEGEIYTLYDVVEMRQIIPAQTVEALIWNLYRQGGYHEYEYEGVGDVKLVKEVLWRRWTVRAMQDELEARGIKKSRGYIQKLFAQWKDAGMNGSQEQPKQLTELEHGPVVRYYHTKQLYDSATSEEAKSRLELQLEIAERKLEQWKARLLPFVGSAGVTKIVTLTESKSCASKD